MEIGKKIKVIRSFRNLSTYDLSSMTGISQSTISKLENGKRKVDIEILRKIAEALGVSLAYLTGESLLSIIEERLIQLGMTIEELSEKSKVPMAFFNNLDNIIPDGYNYQYIIPIAIVLNVKPGVLFTAFSRQEPPVYDGPQRSAKENFGEKFDSKYDTGELREEVSTYKAVDKILKPLGTNIIDAINNVPNQITDVKEAMKLILSQPGLMLNGEMLSDESKIALANAIQLGLQYAEQMQKKEKGNK